MKRTPPPLAPPPHPRHHRPLLSLPLPATSPFDADWRFSTGDPQNAQSPSFPDQSWRSLDLPHDFSIEGPYDQNAITLRGGGYLPNGIAWYRKTFTLPPDSQNKSIFVDFDGVMANAEVFINGPTHRRQRLGLRVSPPSKRRSHRQTTIGVTRSTPSPSAATTPSNPPPVSTPAAGSTATSTSSSSRRHPQHPHSVALGHPHHHPRHKARASHHPSRHQHHQHHPRRRRWLPRPHTHRSRPPPPRPAHPPRAKHPRRKIRPHRNRPHPPQP